MVIACFSRKEGIMTESIYDFIHIIFFIACIIASYFYAFNMTSFL